MSRVPTLGSMTPANVEAATRAAGASGRRDRRPLVGPAADRDGRVAAPDACAGGGSPSTSRPIGRLVEQTSSER